MRTIYALSTANAKSGIAVIRVSGKQAARSCAALGIALPAPRYATFVRLKDSDGAVIDEALALYFAAHHSFTGEDVLEYHVHGSRAVIARILEVFSQLEGFFLAEPGEFTRRAYMNGKMDLTAAEGIADLIDAETESQRKQALRFLQGDGSRFYEQLRGKTLHALAYLEAYIDFPEEDIPLSVLAEIDAELASVAASIATQLQGRSGSERIRDGVFVTILGAPNVGKSSLLNLLAGRDAAIVSEQAGTTRDVIEVHLDIGGYSVILSDTAGIREQAETIEKEGIRRSLARAESADIKLVVVDASQNRQDASIIGLIDGQALVVANKSDLATGMLPESWLAISVKNGQGIDALLAALTTRISAMCTSEAAFVTRARHREHLTAAQTHLRLFSIAKSKGLELGCEEIRRAAVEIGKITGKISVDELLGHIFSSFCIGK